MNALQKLKCLLAEREVIPPKLPGAVLPATGADDRPVANDPTLADWKTLDRAYLAHHAQCPHCIAAGRGYGQRCGTGAALWRSYEAVPYPFDRHKRSNSGKTS